MFGRPAASKRREGEIRIIRTRRAVARIYTQVCMCELSGFGSGTRADVGVLILFQRAPRKKEKKDTDELRQTRVSLPRGRLANN